MRCQGLPPPAATQSAVAPAHRHGARSGVIGVSRDRIISAQAARGVAAALHRNGSGPRRQRECRPACRLSADQLGRISQARRLARGMGNDADDSGLHGDRPFQQDAVLRCERQKAPAQSTLESGGNGPPGLPPARRRLAPCRRPARPPHRSRAAAGRHFPPPGCRPSVQAA